MNNKVNEWQELSLKKDIEKILRYLKKKRKTELFLSVEATIALLTLYLDVFDKKDASVMRTIIFVIIVLITTITIIYYLKTKIESLKNKYKTYNSFSMHELVDLFDNDICYCIMTANSYYEMLKNVSAGQNNNIFEFYYIETWYYINKTKYQLQRMIYKEKDIFTNDPNQIVNKNMISLTRLLNIIALIESLQNEIESLTKKSSYTYKCSDYEELRKINIRYDINYQDFIDSVKRSLNEQRIIITKVKDLYDY